MNRTNLLPKPVLATTCKLSLCVSPSIRVSVVDWGGSGKGWLHARKVFGGGLTVTV